VAELQAAAGQLRLLGEAICGVAQCAEASMAEHGDTVAGVGLRDRTIIVADAGRSAITSAEMLEKISRATAATLRKVEQASPVDSGDAGPQSLGPVLRENSLRGMVRNTGAVATESGNMLTLGCKLLSESLARIAAVSWRSADEAIGSATKAMDLSRCLAAVDSEVRKDKERSAARRQQADDGHEDLDNFNDVENCEDLMEIGKSGEDAQAAKLRLGGCSLKIAEKRVKERHVALRVKNLRFLSSLNEETLKIQSRLWSLLGRSAGALLPEISIAQKSRIFELVSQLLDFAIMECSRLVTNVEVAAPRILERALGFAIALEHSNGIAVPSDSRTQALKLAALIDMDLLGHIIDGPFRSRLLGLTAQRRAAEKSGNSSRYARGCSPSRARAGAADDRGRLRRTSGGFEGGSQQDSNASSGLAPPSWEDAVHACCERFLYGLRCILPSEPQPGVIEAASDAAF
jgi:hypothetical protein